MNIPAGCKILVNENGTKFYFNNSRLEYVEWENGDKAHYENGQILRMVTKDNTILYEKKLAKAK